MTLHVLCEVAPELDEIPGRPPCWVCSGRPQVRACSRAPSRELLQGPELRTRSSALRGAPHRSLRSYGLLVMTTKVQALSVCAFKKEKQGYLLVRIIEHSRYLPGWTQGARGWRQAASPRLSSALPGADESEGADPARVSVSRKPRRRSTHTSDRK